MDLTLISQWLKHSNIETTLVYAHADTEDKRKSIEKAAMRAGYSEANNDRHTANDEAILKQYTGCAGLLFYTELFMKP